MRTDDYLYGLNRLSFRLLKLKLLLYWSFFFKAFCRLWLNN